MHCKNKECVFSGFAVLFIQVSKNQTEFRRKFYELLRSCNNCIDKFEKSHYNMLISFRKEW